MILSVGFFAYSWTVNEHFVVPILAGGYFAEAVNRVVRLPVWVNQTLFFVVNGLVWGAVVFLGWSLLTRLWPRGKRRAASHARAADSLLAFGSSLAADAPPVRQRTKS
jgi:hypothetical protein